MWYQYLAEFLGSAILVYVILITQSVLALGVAYILLLMLTVRFSGGFFNPMITLVMSMMNQLPRREMLLYILAQILGGIAGLEVYKQSGGGKEEFRLDM